MKGTSSRGICYAQKTLEIFKRLGIYDRIAAKGVQWGVGRTFAGHDEVYLFDLAAANTHNVSTQPPFINIQQFYVEGFLVEQLYADSNRTIDLRWNYRITAFEQNADFATLSITTTAGDYKIEVAHVAAHVIDCSGARSPFRAWCNASVTAKKGDDRWCIADVRFKTPPPVEHHTWIEESFNKGRAVWQHLMADGVWRIDYQMRQNADPQEVSREDVVRQRINGQLGRVVSPSEYASFGLARTPTAANALTSCAMVGYFLLGMRRMWSARLVRAAATRASRMLTTWPGNWQPWYKAAPLPNCSTVTTKNATRPPCKTCWLPTEPPAFCAPRMAWSVSFAAPPSVWPSAMCLHVNWSTRAACQHPTPTAIPASAGLQAGVPCRT